METTPLSERANRAWCVVFGLESATIILGNILIIAVFSIIKSLHRKTYYLFISLAVADLLVGAVALPLYIHLIGGTVTRWWDVHSHVSHTFTAIDIFTAYASIFFLVAIALERLFAVLSPLKHANTKSAFYYGAIITVWMLALLLSILSFLREQHVGKANRRAVFLFIMVMLGLSMLTLIISYLIIGVVLLSSHRSRKDQANHVQKRLAWTLFVLSAIFIVTWLPFKIINYIFHFDPATTLSCGAGNLACLYNAIYAVKFLHYFNSVINPFMYAMGVSDFRKGVRRLLCGCVEPRSPQNPPIGEIKGIDNMVSMESVNTVVPSMYL